jgi:hypothetical protein
MKKTIVSIGLLTAIMIGFNTTNQLQGNSSGAPAGRTGAPRETTGNETTCAVSGCHGSNLNVGPNTATISIVDNPVSFDPGVTYTMNVKINNPTGTAAGFQILALNPQRASIGTFTAGTGNKVITLSGRNYVTHTARTSRSWTFTWTAPSSANAPDSVTFYAASMEKVNQIFNTYSTDFVFRKTINTRIESAKSKGNFSIFPTFANDKITVKDPENQLKGYTIQIIGMDGREYLNQPLPEGNGDVEILLPADLKAGSYIFRTVGSKGYQTRHFIKL